MRTVSRPQNRYVLTSRRPNDSAHLLIQSKVETVVVVMETTVVVMATYNLNVQDKNWLRVGFFFSWFSTRLRRPKTYSFQKQVLGRLCRRCQVETGTTISMLTLQIYQGCFIDFNNLSPIKQAAMVFLSSRKTAGAKLEVRQGGGAQNRAMSKTKKVKPFEEFSKGADGETDREREDEAT